MQPKSQHNAHTPPTKTKVGGTRITYAAHSAAGAEPGGAVKPNQDAWSVQEALGGQPGLLMLGVYDGHGGVEVARCVRQWAVATAAVGASR